MKYALICGVLEGQSIGNLCVRQRARREGDGRRIRERMEGRETSRQGRRKGGKGE